MPAITEHIALTEKYAKKWNLGDIKPKPTLACILMAHRTYLNCKIPLNYLLNAYFLTLHLASAGIKPSLIEVDVTTTPSKLRIPFDKEVIALNVALDVGRMSCIEMKLNVLISTLVSLMSANLWSLKKFYPLFLETINARFDEVSCNEDMPSKAIFLIKQGKIHFICLDEALLLEEH